MHKPFLVVVLMMLASLVQADVYKWVDGNGTVHYGDTPPANARTRSVDLRFAGTATTTEANTCCIAKEEPPKPAQQPVYIVTPRNPRDNAARLEWTWCIIMLRRGMSEGELCACRLPDLESPDGKRAAIA